MQLKRIVLRQYFSYEASVNYASYKRKKCVYCSTAILSFPTVAKLTSRSGREWIKHKVLNAI